MDEAPVLAALYWKYRTARLAALEAVELGNKVRDLHASLRRTMAIDAGEKPAVSPLPLQRAILHLIKLRTRLLQQSMDILDEITDVADRSIGAHVSFDGILNGKRIPKAWCLPSPPPLPEDPLWGSMTVAPPFTPLRTQLHDDLAQTLFDEATLRSYGGELDQEEEEEGGSGGAGGKKGKGKDKDGGKGKDKGKKPKDRSSGDGREKGRGVEGIEGPIMASYRSCGHHLISALRLIEDDFLSRLVGGGSGGQSIDVEAARRIVTLCSRICCVASRAGRTILDAHPSSLTAAASSEALTVPFNAIIKVLTDAVAVILQRGVPAAAILHRLAQPPDAPAPAGGAGDLDAAVYTTLRLLDPTHVSALFGLCGDIFRHIAGRPSSSDEERSSLAAKLLPCARIAWRALKGSSRTSHALEALGLTLPSSVTAPPRFSQVVDPKTGVVETIEVPPSTTDPSNKLLGSRSGMLSLAILVLELSRSVSAEERSADGPGSEVWDPVPPSAPHQTGTGKGGDLASTFPQGPPVSLHRRLGESLNALGEVHMSPAGATPGGPPAAVACFSLAVDMFEAGGDNENTVIARLNVVHVLRLLGNTAIGGAIADPAAARSGQGGMTPLVIGAGDATSVRLLVPSPAHAMFTKAIEVAGTAVERLQGRGRADAVGMARASHGQTLLLAAAGYSRWLRAACEVEGLATVSNPSESTSGDPILALFAGAGCEYGSITPPAEGKVAACHYQAALHHQRVLEVISTALASTASSPSLVTGIGRAGAREYEESARVWEGVSPPNLDDCMLAVQARIAGVEILHSSGNPPLATLNLMTSPLARSLRQLQRLLGHKRVDGALKERVSGFASDLQKLLVRVMTAGHKSGSGGEWKKGLGKVVAAAGKASIPDVIALLSDLDADFTGL